MNSYLQNKLREPTLYQTVFHDGYVVWKPLPWSEYRRLREARAIVGHKIDLELEETIFEKCVIYSSYDDEPEEELDEVERLLYREASRAHQLAGIISSVVKNILFVSGCMDLESIADQLDEHRYAAMNVEDQLIAAVCKAFPAYTPEDVEKLDWQTFLRRVAQAEQVLGKPFDLRPKPEKPRQVSTIDMERDRKELEKALSTPHKDLENEELEMERKKMIQEAKRRRLRGMG